MVVYAQRRKRLHHPDLERAKCMEDVYHILARRTLMAAKQTDVISANKARYMIGVVGSPGSGKSTLAKQTTKIINAIQQDEVAVVLPMDGYHYTKKQLDGFKDPEAAHARRGAHWTFDADAFVDKVREVATDAGSVKYAPTFDHGQGDPVKDGVCIERHHTIVFVEGLYLLLDAAPWKQLRDVFDETWYIDCDVDEAMRRVYNRMTRNGRLPRDARHRIESNDRPNAMEVLNTACDADMMLPSLNFRRPYWR
jgi:pantothenate kinase